MRRYARNLEPGPCAGGAIGTIGAIGTAFTSGTLGGGAQQVAMTGGATVDIRLQADGMKVKSTETESEDLISRVNLNRGPSMATG